MTNIMSNSLPCAGPRVRLLPGASPLAAAFVVLAAVDVQTQGTGVSTHSVDKYGGQGSRAWSPPD
jgi:hypothetical protein